MAIGKSTRVMPACPTPAVAGCRKVFPDLESWQGSDLGVVGAPKRSWTWRDVGGVQERFLTLHANLSVDQNGAA